VTHISTDEAKKLNLPGSDSFRSSALAYYNDLSRKRYVVDLRTIAYECLKNISLTQPSPPAEMYLNFLKIGTLFEIYLKSVLLEKGFLIHLFDSRLVQKMSLFQYFMSFFQKKYNNDLNKLLKRQKKQPIQFQVAIDTFGFRYDDSDPRYQKNVLGGVSNKSLEFGTILLKPKYLEHLGLNAQELKLVKLFREFRNHIHSPGDFEYISSPEDVIYTWEWLFNFVNEKIVEITNKSIVDNDLHSSLSLQKLYPALGIKDNVIIPMTGFSS